MKKAVLNLLMWAIVFMITGVMTGCAVGLMLTDYNAGEYMSCGGAAALSIICIVHLVRLALEPDARRKSAKDRLRQKEAK